MAKPLLPVLVLMAALALAGCQKKVQSGDEFIGHWVSADDTHDVDLKISHEGDKFIVKAANEGGLIDGTFAMTYDAGHLDPHNIFGTIVYDKPSDTIRWASTQLKREKDDKS